MTPPKRRRIYLMRHGSVDYFDAEGRPVPPLTVPLNRSGQRQADAAGAVFAQCGVRFDKVITSGLNRTLEVTGPQSCVSAQCTTPAERAAAAGDDHRVHDRSASLPGWRLSMRRVTVHWRFRAPVPTLQSIPEASDKDSAIGCAMAASKCCIGRDTIGRATVSPPLTPCSPASRTFGCRI